jgi:copper chaperone
MIHTIEVENIRCGGCTNTITKALMELNGVDHVQIDKSTGMIQVNGDIERSVVVDKLSALGYPESGHNSLLLRGKSLVSCAVGKLNS